MNWNDEIKLKAESLILGSVQINKSPDTLTDTMDRSTLSKSTLGANKTDEYEAPCPGVNSNVLKLKASSQLLESFVGNETADTFDTIQDREVNLESTAGTETTVKAGNATSSFNQSHAKFPLRHKAHEAAANFNRRWQMQMRKYMHTATAILLV